MNLYSIFLLIIKSVVIESGSTIISMSYLQQLWIRNPSSAIRSSATRFHLMCLNTSQQHQLVYPNQNKNLKLHTPCLHQGGACEAPISFLIVGDFWSGIMNASVDPVAVLCPIQKTLGSKQPPDITGPEIIPATLWWMPWVILQLVIWLLLLVIVY